MKTRHIAVSEPGARHQNQDAYVAENPVFGVFDGMGGHPNGGLASAIAASHFKQMAKTPGQQFREVRGNAIREMFSREGFQVNRKRMGTTAAVLHLGHKQVAWAGDSRVYLLRNGILRRETQDHNTGYGLTNYLGQGSTLPMSVQSVLPRVGDRYYLVTDGTYVLTDDQMETILSGSKGLVETVRTFGDAVRTHEDLSDNFTILGVEILG